MEPDGISVVEISLWLPNACYYLHWMQAAPDSLPERRGRLSALRGVSRRFGWQVFAAGVDTGGGHLLFETSGDNPEAGFNALLRNAGSHRLYLVQAETALPQIACHIHNRNDAYARRPSAAGHTEGLPAIHYGLFMGKRAWARRMLELLTSCSGEYAPPAREPCSLGEIADACSSRQEGMIEAYRSGRFSLKDIAEYFNMHFSEVSAVINVSSRKGL